MVAEDAPRSGPVEPEVSPWQLPDPRRLPPELEDEDLVGVGADLAPGTLMAAYRSGLFPMHVFLEDDDESRPDDTLGWWSPNPRGVLPLASLQVSRSLRQSLKHFEVTVNQSFAEVIAGCANEHRPQGWINAEITDAYLTLHRLGWAHSLEVWQNGSLVGGLYGVSIGGLFAGESMFHLVRDASKVALVHLVEVMGQGESERLLDVQWLTPHLASMGATEVSRSSYLDLLEQALAVPRPTAFDWAR